MRDPVDEAEEPPDEAPASEPENAADDEVEVVAAKPPSALVTRIRRLDHASPLALCAKFPLDGQPLAGARVQLVPEPLHGARLQPTTGTTNALRAALLSVEGAAWPGGANGL